MSTSSGPSLKGLLQQLLCTALAATGGASARWRGGGDGVGGRETCPRWPDLDTFTYDFGRQCKYVFPAEEALGRRWRAEGHRSGMADAFHQMARLGCVSDPLTTHFFHHAYHELEAWQGISRAEIFSGDTILLKPWLPEDAPTSPARLLEGATRRIWRRRRVAFVGFIAGAESRRQVEAWAAAGGAGHDARVFFQGALAGPLTAAELRGRLPGAADAEAWAAVTADGAPRLLGLEEPRLAAARALARALYAGDHEVWAERALTYIVDGGAGLLGAWGEAFTTAHTDVERLCADFLSLSFRERMAPSLRFVGTLVAAFDREDPEIADALRCMFALPWNGATEFFGREERLFGAPRERAWAAALRATIDRHPEAPILVVGETQRLMGLRARLAADEALPPWPAEAARRGRGHGAR